MEPNGFFSRMPNLGSVNEPSIAPSATSSSGVTNSNSIVYPDGGKNLIRFQVIPVIQLVTAPPSNSNSASASVPIAVPASAPVQAVSAAIPAVTLVASTALRPSLPASSLPSDSPLSVSSPLKADLLTSTSSQSAIPLPPSHLPLPHSALDKHYGWSTIAETLPIKEVHSHLPSKT